MKHGTHTGRMFGEQLTLEQINITKARKLFLEGKKVFLQSCNMEPFNPWQSAYEIGRSEEDLESRKELYESLKKKVSEKYQIKNPTYLEQFENTCNNYGYYNLDSERGLYINFYVAL